MLVGDLGWAYVAGFFDGEGCVRLYARNNRLTGYTARVTIVQTKPRGLQVLQEIADLLRSHTISCSIYSKEHGNPEWSDCHSLVLGTNRGVVAFLHKVLPYLRIKKVEALDTLRFIRMYGLVPRKSPVLAMLISESWSKPGVRESRIIGIRKSWESRRLRCS